MPYKILIVAPSWVGDSVMAQPLYRRLKEIHPDLELHVFAPQWTRPLLARMPEVTQTHFNPFEHGQLQLLARYKVARQLQTEHFDQAIVLPNSLKSALIPFFSRIPIRTGYLGEMRKGVLNDIHILDEIKYPKMVDRFYALADNNENLTEAPFPILKVDPKTQQETVKELNLNFDGPIVAFCPGAEYGPAKKWPEQHFANLAKRYKEDGFSICIFGSQKDQQTAQSINELSGNICTDLCGKTTLAQAIDLLALTQIVICNDSGLMHIAAALGRPLVALYGSSSPDFTPPLTDKAQILNLHLDCSPCFERVCPLGHTNCLNQLTPDMVWEASNKLLENKP